MKSIKPLRIYLRPLNCVSMLQAVWYLSNHLEFGQPLPAYLAAANPNRLKDPLRLRFFLWELDTLRGRRSFTASRLTVRPSRVGLTSRPR